MPRSSSQDSSALLIMLAIYGFFAVLIGLLAWRKNRSGAAWGLIGGFVPVLALAALAFASYLCPNCQQPISNDEAKSGKCPRCAAKRRESEVAPQSVAAQPQEAEIAPRSAASAHRRSD